MQVTTNGAGAPNYFPNSFSGPAPQTSAQWHADTVMGQVQRVDTGDEDNFSQCRDFYNKTLDAAARERLTDNIAKHLSGVTQPAIQKRVIANFAAVDQDYGRKIATKLAQMPPPQPRRALPAAALSPPRARCPFGFSSSKL